MTSTLPLDDLTTPSAVYAELERLGGGPSQTLGQNFLTDRPLLEAMVGALDLQPEEPVLEVGPGLGHLTRALLERGARVLAVEKDRRLAETLGERLGNPPTLRVLHEDVLKVTVDFIADCLQTDCFVIAGNLPYYCSSPILIRFFEKWWPHWDRAGILLQEEVVDRLVAPPRNKVYGRLSVLVQAFSEAKKIRKVSPHLFVPRPEVVSAWCSLRARAATAPDLDPVHLGRVTGWCFAERRKTLLNNLSRVFPKPEARAKLEEAGLDPGRRPEELSVEEFIRLAAVLPEE